jgi:hypothetical protein
MTKGLDLAKPEMDKGLDLTREFLGKAAVENRLYLEQIQLFFHT